MAVASPATRVRSSRPAIALHDIDNNTLPAVGALARNIVSQINEYGSLLEDPSPIRGQYAQLTCTWPRRLFASCSRSNKAQVYRRRGEDAQGFQGSSTMRRASSRCG